MTSSVQMGCHPHEGLVVPTYETGRWGVSVPPARAIPQGGCWLHWDCVETGFLASGCLGVGLKKGAGLQGQRDPWNRETSSPTWTLLLDYQIRPMLIKGKGQEWGSRIESST